MEQGKSTGLLGLSETATRNICILFSLLLGGSGSAVAIDAITTDPFKGAEELTRRIDLLEKDVYEIKTSVDGIGTVLNKQVARDAALKAVEHVEDKAESIQLYNHMYDKNMWRLRQKMEPCFTLDCSE